MPWSSSRIWAALRRLCWGRPSLPWPVPDRKSTRLNSSHVRISYAVFCLKKNRNLTMQPIDPGFECLVCLGGEFDALFVFEASPRDDSLVCLNHRSPRHHVSIVVFISAVR